MKQTENSVLPLLQAFTKLIQDQKDRVVYNQSSSNQGMMYKGAHSQGTTVVEYSQHTTASGTTVWSSSSRPAAPQGEENVGDVADNEEDKNEENKENEEPKEKELTFPDMLNDLNNEQ